MTVRLNVRTDVRQVQKLFRELGAGVDRAAARALNDAMTTVRAEGARAIKREHPAMLIGDIKRAMRITKAHARRLTASAAVSGRPLSLLSFKARGTRRGVTAQIGKSRHPISYQGRKAFIVHRFAGEVFVRKFARGRQIRRFRGPSLPGVFRARLDEFNVIAAARWKVTFPNRMKFEIAKAEAKARGA